MPTKAPVAAGSLSALQLARRMIADGEIGRIR
jgi:hypothetical protein